MSTQRVVITAPTEVRSYTRPLFVSYGITSNQLYLSKAAAAIIGHIAANPFYVVQTLAQVGNKEGKKPYSKIVEDLFNREGVSAFFKGSLVGAFRFASTATLNYLLNLGFKKLFGDKDGVVTVDQDQIIYAASIIVSSILTYPLETVRTRLILDWEGRKYTGASDCWANTVANEGWIALFRGATLSSVANYAMIEVMERIWTPLKLGLAIVPPSFAEAVAQSLLAQVLYYPVDTVIKMVQAPSHYRSLHPDVQFDGVIEAASATVARHGFFSLWRGASIAALGVVPQIAAVSLAYSGTTQLFQDVGVVRTVRTPVVRVAPATVTTVTRV